jgi:flagellar export protein FliJ
MKFRFPLQALMRLRESIEEAELQRLQAAAARVLQARGEIEQIDAAIAAARRDEALALETGGYAAELQFSSLRDQIYAQQRNLLQSKLAELERVRAEHQERYRQARQQREILSNLRSRQFAAFQIESSRREQRETDDLFLMRRNRPSED